MSQDNAVVPGTRQAVVPASWAQHIRHLWRVIAAESLKQHRNLFGNRLIYFSMLVWPGLELATMYYTFRPLAHSPGIVQRWSLAGDPRSVTLFFILGMLGFTFFWSLVQSAWQFSLERFYGTLELLFLTPANRLVLIMANGAVALVQSVWLFLTFSLGLIAIVGGLRVAHPLMFVLAFFTLLIPALAWATFLSCIFIFARDAGLLFSLTEGTLSFLSGVRIPLFAYPGWLRAIGLLIPLTTSLVVLRGVLMEGQTLGQVWLQLCFLTLLSALLFLASAWILRRGEKHAREQGTLVLF